MTRDEMVQAMAVIDAVPGVMVAQRPRTIWRETSDPRRPVRVEIPQEPVRRVQYTGGEYEGDGLYGRLYVSVPCRGGSVVRALDHVLTAADAVALIAELDREARQSDRATAGRLRIEREQDRS